MLTLDPRRLDRMNPWADRYVAERKFPGLSVLIRQGDQEVYFNATGLRDLDSGAPFARDTLARIYSMTKPVTALALMMLIEEGAFTLDAPVSRFLPEFADARALIPGATSLDQTMPCAPPTLHQLLTHTSGLSYPFNASILSEEMAAQDLLFKPGAGSLAAQCNAVAALPLAFQPGTQWEYSVGIDVIGRVIEVVTGQSLGEVFHSRIFEPLGLSETAFDVPQSRRDRFASLYTPLAGDAMDLNSAASGGDSLRCVDHADGSPFLDPTLHSGGGGLVGTLDDYMLFADCLRARVSLTSDMSGRCNKRSVRFYSVSERRRYEPSRSVTGSSTYEVRRCVFAANRRQADARAGRRDTGCIRAHCPALGRPL
ncbi:serine hydrolase domain-containing protein [Tateyamaria sp.]|uniref:serine hydrolase domain-containing protein n=1 Tax=Tateyamaria sp. TaxID=1929288 RepID=UPI003B21034C